jgi:hypothetical protein
MKEINRQGPKLENKPPISTSNRLYQGWRELLRMGVVSELNYHEYVEAIQRDLA